MHTRPLLHTLALLLFSVSVFAQKAQPRSDLEIGEITAKSSYVNVDRRQEAGSDRILSLYQAHYWAPVGTPQEQADKYLADRGWEFGLTEEAVAELSLQTVRENVSGATVRYRQYHQGVRVHGGAFSLTILPNRSVVMVNNDFVPGVSLANVRPTVTADRALATSLAHLGVRPTDRYELLARELVILPREDDPRLAHRVTVLAFDPHGEWEAFVDARSGELLQVSNRAIYYHGHEPEDTYVPLPLLVNGTGTTFDPDPLSTAGATYGDPGFVDNNDNTSFQLMNQQVTRTLLNITNTGGTFFLSGPWAEIVDFDSPFKGLFSQSTSDWTFNRDDDAFEAVTCYYHIDASMRYLNNTLGLSIRPSSYTTGVRVDPSGVGGSDNSYYSGGAQRLSFGEGGVDDAEDSDVIHHELGHGLHDWVTGGNLSQNEGLSEGVGDYWAASYNRSLGLWEPSDDAYHHVFTWDGHNQFWNGRRVDDTRSYPSGINGSIHSSGMIWATTNMQIWDALGQIKTDRIFWNGLGMTGGSTNQNDAANAVYQAALADPGLTGQDRLQVHTIYTARGYTLPSFSLPVEWLTVEAQAAGKAVEVRWSTATETDNDYFTVQRSTDDGRTFTDLGRVAPNDRQAYRFTDESPAAGRNLYRIRQTDVDGRSSLSRLVEVDFDVAGAELLLPNPAGSVVYLRLPAGKTGGTVATLHDLTGRELRRVSVNGSTTEVRLDGLAAGTYLLRFEVDGLPTVRRFVKR